MPSTRKDRRKPIEEKVQGALAKIGPPAFEGFVVDNRLKGSTEIVSALERALGRSSSSHTKGLE